MGGLTRTEIITAGLANTSRSDLSDFAVTEFKAWLRQKAAEWSWPTLFRRIESVALAAGTRSLSIGNGANGVTPQIQRIIDPIWIGTSDYSQGTQLRVQSMTDGLSQYDESINDPVNKRARPVVVKVRPNTSLEGKWDLWFSPVPERAYVLDIDYILLPADPGASDKPWYPNDITMIKMVECLALKYAKRYDVLAQERQVLEAMGVGDRMRYGQIAGANDTLTLDSGIFR